MLRKRTGGGRFRVAADDATTDEDHPTSIDARANDRAGSARRALHVLSTDTEGTRGDASVNDDGTIGYDPARKLDALKPGEVERDTFRYRAGDGVHTADATVTVTVTGVNDAPTAVDDSASTSEDPPGPERIDLIKAAAAAGSAGKDTDPESDPLVVHSVDAAGVEGGVVSSRGDGTAEYHPSGKFEALGAGQTDTDTFGYQLLDSGGAVSNRAAVTVTIAGQNDSPSLSGVASDVAQVQSGAIVAPATNRVAAGIEVSDVDTNPGLGGETIRGATAQITRGLDTAHHDTLTTGALPSGISASYEPGAGLLEFTGSASRADYQAALRSVAFSTDIDAPTSDASGLPLDRTVTFQVDDGGPENNLSNLVTRDIHVTNALPAVSAQPGLTPGFAHGVSDYAVRCVSGDAVEVDVTAPEGTEVAVDGDEPRSGAFTTPVDLAPGQGFDVAVRRADESDSYHVRCLPANFPAYTATVVGEPQAQWFFVTPSRRLTNNQYAVIFNNDGVPVWWKESVIAPVDFKLLSNGNVGWFSPSTKWNEFKLDGSFVGLTETVGTPTDPHDYQELPNGNRYLMSYKLRDHVDVSAYTGKPEDTDAAVTDAEVQEIAPDGSLVWKWNSGDHLDLAETGRWWAALVPAKTSDGRNIYDIAHINSVEHDGDGIVMSLRHTDSLYRVARDTGQVDWKLGGTSTPESLTILGDDANAATDFGGQHDARILPDGSVALHDNGTNRGRAPRAMRFTLDLGSRTATAVETLADPEAAVSGCCGSARRLPGGNWVMSWGQTPLVTELALDGSRPFKLVFETGVFSYRAAPVLPGVLAPEALRAGMDAQFPRP